MTNTQLRKHRFVFAHSQWNHYDSIKEIAHVGSMNLANMINTILAFGRSRSNTPMVINRGKRQHD